MTATVESIVAAARLHLRDTDRFFAATVTKNSDTSRTFKLPHQNVDSHGLSVHLVQASGTRELTPLVDFQLDGRNGLIRLTEDAEPVDGHLNVEGYYHRWFTTADMMYFARTIVMQHGHHVTDFDLASIELAEEDLLALGTVVEALWSLWLDIARDIDLNTPEAVSLPLSQRYRQVGEALQAMENEYKERAEMLNVGLYRIEQFTLRRTSYTTGRLVPLFRPREFDDASPPTRVFTDQQYIDSTLPDSDYRPIWDPGVSPVVPTP